MSTLSSLLIRSVACDCTCSSVVCKSLSLKCNTDASFNYVMTSTDMKISPSSV